MDTASSVLIIGATPAYSADIGAAQASDFAQARALIKQRPPAVVIFGSDSGRTKAKDLQEFCEFLEAAAPHAQWLVTAEGLKPTQIINLANQGRLFDLLGENDEVDMINKVQAALERSGQWVQESQLATLFSEQTRHLKRLKEELEARVEKRQRTLRKSKKTLDSTKTRLEGFHRALIGVHQATSVQAMEQALNDSLAATMQGVQVRVRFAQQSSLAQLTGTLAIEIPFQNDDLKGELLFATSDGRKFSPNESDFLFELTEALALALSRLHTLQLAATLKTQWQATFDSIPHPLCLVTRDFEIVKLNLAFQQSCPRHSFRDLIGKNCFQAFLGHGFQPPRTQTYRVTRSGAHGLEHFEVSGDDMGLTHDDQAVRMLLLRPITEEVRYERRIFEASKLAELGTIGSSIAHELNNPLGGMLSFLQLILLDLKAGQPHYSDIKSMEQATLRCRDIVQNLLSFARKQDLGRLTEVDLWEVVSKAVKLIELQSKSKGIEIDVRKGPAALVLASANALSQALCNLLQNSIDALTDRMTREPLYPGRIHIELAQNKNDYQLRISDNGTGIKPEVQSRIFNPLFTTRDPGLFSGMGLTTAFTIISDHHGSLEILSQTGSGTSAIVSLPISRKSNF